MNMAIIKFVFYVILGFHVCRSLSIENEFSLSYVRKSNQYMCEDDAILLNFSNAVITDINENFISSPSITCLIMTRNNIKNIKRNAFNKLPNLTQLFLSDNNLQTKYILNFGGHNALQILIINNAVEQNYDYNRHDYNDYDNSYDNNYNDNRYNYNRHNYNFLTTAIPKRNNMYDYNTGHNVSIFGEYPNLKILSLKKNSITDLYVSDNIIPFPRLEMLDLSENDLLSSRFISLMPSSLHFLDLHNNSFQHFTHTMLNKLITLNLNNNNLNYIQYINNERNGLLLIGMKNLKYLSVSNNRITDIELDAFVDTNQLIYLNLSRNHLNNLYPEIFSNLPNLEVLDLSENKCLKNFPQILREMQITILYLNSNCIKKLTPQIFANIPKLTKLLLGENMIDEIDVYSFNGLSILEELDLSKNMLSFLPKGWTDSLISLKYLDLSDNKFTSLEALSLTNDLSLINVYVMMNPLEYLNVNYFDNLPQNLTIHLVNKSSFAERNKIDSRNVNK